MEKWYENSELDNNIVLSSRIRLARNIKKYPFSNVITNEQASIMINELKASIKNEETKMGEYFDFIDMQTASSIDKYAMLENHIISQELLRKKEASGILIQKDESASILLNEEDHIRIQTIFPGYNIDNAWKLADNIDNLIEGNIEYAFDKDYGYLTSCVTNTGTGLRASFMIHIPILEKSGQLRNIIQAISKFGITLRGIYGEGSEPMGSIYQISNQITLGKSEIEILEGLKNITCQIIEQENMLRNSVIENQKDDFKDKIYRSYGILQYCKKISAKEAIQLLSDIRLGYISGIIDLPKPKANIYNIMMNIQPGNLQKHFQKQYSEDEKDTQRAKFINQQFQL